MPDVRRLPRALARGARSFWRSAGPPARRRLAFALASAAVALVALMALTPALPCQFPGGDECAPADDARRLVPADALAYVHVNLEPGSEHYEEASAFAAQVPLASRQAIDSLGAQVPGREGAPASFERDIEPWFGGQAALAIVPEEAGAQVIGLLEVGDEERAEEFAESLAGQAGATEHHGVEIQPGEGGLASATVGGFFVFGTEAGVRGIVDVGAEGAEAGSLADDEPAQDVRDELPSDRFVTAHVSEDGIERLIAGQRAPLSPLEPFVDAGAAEAAAASLGAGGEELELAVRSSLDPERAAADPGFFAAFPAFEPELPDRLDPESLGYVGVGEPGTTVRELVAQASARAPALAQGFAALVRRVRELGEIDLEEELLPALGGEAAFALQPAGGEPPVLQFLATDVDVERGREALARLQGPIAEALDPGTALRAPGFHRRNVGGVEVQVVDLTPTVELSYALADSRLVVATQPQGVAQAIAGDGGLVDAESFERATEGFPERVSTLAYLDLEGLVGLAEREGLAEDPAYAALAGEIGRLGALGLAIAAEGESIATDARLVLAPDAAP